MRVLIACEESQELTFALRSFGVEAFSCDVQECSGGFPEWHICDDVFNVVRAGKWGALIGFPPCTHLTFAGAKYFAEKRLDGRQRSGLTFFHLLWGLPIPIMCLENPSGIVSSSLYLKKWFPDFKPLPWSQVVSPHFFGDDRQKRTFLWFRGLPPLLPTSSGAGVSWVQQVGGTAQQKQKTRSKLSPFLAEAMASQWHFFLK